MSTRALVVTVLAFALGAAVDVVIDTSHFPGYSAAVGLFGCVVIVVVSKWAGKALLQRPEDHWPEDVPADTQEDLRG